MKTKTLHWKKPSRIPSDEFKYRSFDELPLYDHRYLPRWKTTNKAFYRDEEAFRIVRTQTVDLSCSGVALYADESIHVNRRVFMKIYLDEFHSLEVKGTVMWRSQKDGKVLAGVLFDKLGKEAEDLILSFAFEDKEVLKSVES